MLGLPLPQTPAPLVVLALGAHSDDIEIGCGATILRLLQDRPETQVHWHVFSGQGTRAQEAQRSAGDFLKRGSTKSVSVHGYRDGFFPYTGAEIKETFEQLKAQVQPDVIFTHARHDLHQDHRLLCELTRNTWRNHLILEYEIMKYDADLGAPNVYIPVTRAQAKRKVDLLMKHFGTQRSKQWFDEETFWGLLRLRGLECNSSSKYAE